MGNSVRRLYEQGREVDGAGINCSVTLFVSYLTIFETFIRDIGSDLTGYRRFYLDRPGHLRPLLLVRPCNGSRQLE